ncbi:UDP-N-acetylglucosamine--N-acetylmuramyl-(pentapeptide) pyrophosphoryl-undecaprenol N-acetylglucosamine transferase [Paenibacillus yonginensis]|uniref:UDP-N-acetylglucosamine--N-acetylmuramyl-(pentapeptide) pyrophosphoryl-undecaprenol N-acetylglucosamine transferase n=1 Tax=Paenibacillus yonginensis TaxID=1462996 RepID=A0A1B1N119_9BACL|nr:undecaprenyldiphospho-muramoylpentapeptide beta-N-acetylglucosaminyltransferase [Paenibacillus yonginensis]ANS75111.1 UDP-N-acetylglucosamine--N-acetylmuramyl-(pentapeptide) pyrophosphoryl-undecaprenol N-acetylglucosamine transferase [Paenibacillus yonginensis]
MRIVLTGGGTGGHIYPALAVAKQFSEEVPGTEFLYIGGTKGLESKLVPQENIRFEAIEITGFRRKLSFDNVKTVMRFLKGVRTSKRLLKEFKPDVVIGTGGYVCGPVVYAAAKLGIPSVIHEQNAVPGLTNKFLSKYVNAVAVSFEGTEQAFPGAKAVEYTGNPRATTVFKADKERGYASLGLPSGSDIVLVAGGSRGAKAINEAMIDMAALTEKLPNVHFVYVTGESYYEATVKEIRKKAGRMPSRLHVLPYIHNMPEVLAVTKVIAGRSGASFLAEVTSLGIPSILIPSPNVTNNHQEKNARNLEAAGAASVILETNLSGQTLFQEIQRLMKDEPARQAMAEAARKRGKPDSAHVIVEMLRRLAGGNG